MELIEEKKSENVTVLQAKSATSSVNVMDQRRHSKRLWIKQKKEAYEKNRQPKTNGNENMCDSENRISLNCSFKGSCILA